MSIPSPSPAIRRSAPVFLVADVVATIGWYRDNLGFEGSGVPEPPPYDFGILWRDDVQIFLQRLDGYRKPDLYDQREGGVWDAYLNVDGLCELAMALLAGVEILEPMHRQPYGQTELVIRDLNGYVLVLAQSG